MKRSCSKEWLADVSQVERLNLVDGNVEISTLHPPQVKPNTWTHI